MHTKIVETQQLTKTFTHNRVTHIVLQNISVAFHQGNTYAIMGVSGSGKSTLMHLLAGLDQPTSGRVLYDGESLATHSSSQQAQFLNSAIGLLFQNPYLIRELTVIENVMVPALIAHIPYAQAHTHAHTLLDQVGLATKQDLMPSILSGGEQQRVAVARALCNKPAFLLADEPTGNLDERTARTITDLLIHCQQTWHMGLIISTHDIDLARRMQHIYTLHEGQLNTQK